MADKTRDDGDAVALLESRLARSTLFAEKDPHAVVHVLPSTCQPGEKRRRRWRGGHGCVSESPPPVSRLVPPRVCDSSAGAAGLFLLGVTCCIELVSPGARAELRPQPCSPQPPPSPADPSPPFPAALAPLEGPPDLVAPSADTTSCRRDLLACPCRRCTFPAWWRRAPTTSCTALRSSPPGWCAAARLCSAHLHARLLPPPLARMRSPLCALLVCPHRAGPAGVRDCRVPAAQHLWVHHVALLLGLLAGHRLLRRARGRRHLRAGDQGTHDVGARSSQGRQCTGRSAVARKHRQGPHLRSRAAEPHARS